MELYGDSWMCQLQLQRCREYMWIVPFRSSELLEGNQLHLLHGELFTDMYLAISHPTSRDLEFNKTPWLSGCPIEFKSIKIEIFRRSPRTSCSPRYLNIYYVVAMYYKRFLRFAVPYHNNYYHLKLLLIMTFFLNLCSKNQNQQGRPTPVLWSRATCWCAFHTRKLKSNAWMLTLWS